jgi:hypothetical protein
LGAFSSDHAIMGGTATLRRDQPIKLLKEDIAESGHYKEPIGPIIVGVSTAKNFLRTRLHIWKLARIPRRGAGKDARSAAEPRPRARTLELPPGVLSITVRE